MQAVEARAGACPQLATEGARPIGFANPAAENLVGQRLGREPLRRHAAIYGLRRPGGGEFASNDLPAIRALAGENVREVEGEIHRPDGRVVPIEINAMPVRLNADHIAGVVVECHDRTTARQLERLREEFTAVVAHDLRGPISSILARTQLLLERRQGDQVTAPVTAVESIRRCGQRLNQMTDDLIDAARIESARLVLHRQPVTLPGAVELVLNQMRPTLTNLLDNAAKYSPPDARIDIDVRTSGGGTLLSVRDYGMGIEADEIPRLFNRFYQTRRARQRKSGLGLGLYITRGLVEAHGGSIRVESTPGEGTTFHVWFPSAVEQTDDLNAPP